MKKTYTTPALTVWGTLAELTHTNLPHGFMARYALSDGSPGNDKPSDPIPT